MYTDEEREALMWIDVRERELKRISRRRVRGMIASLVAVAASALGAFYLWYLHALNGWSLSVLLLIPAWQWRSEISVVDKALEGYKRRWASVPIGSPPKDDRARLDDPNRSG